MICGHAPHRRRVGLAELGAQAREPVPAGLPLLVVVGLLEERVEVQLLRLDAAREHHQRAAGDERVAVDERGGAVAAQLGGAEPLEQREPDRQQRKARPSSACVRKLMLSRIISAVRYITCSDRMWPASWPSTVRISCSSSSSYGARVDQHDRLVGADRRRVGDRELRQVEVRDLGQVEPRAGGTMGGPQVRDLVGPELDGAGKEDLAQRALVAELDQLAHDHVEHRDGLERGRGGAIGGMLVRLRRDVLQALILGKRVRHADQASGRAA